MCFLCATLQPKVNTRKKAQRVCRKFGIRALANNKPGQNLPYDHPALQEVRLFVQLKAKALGVHERLVLNMDQVWSTNYRPATKSLQKASSGALRSGANQQRWQAAIADRLALALDLPMKNKDVQGIWYLYIYTGVHQWLPS